MLTSKADIHTSRVPPLMATQLEAARKLMLSHNISVLYTFNHLRHNATPVLVVLCARVIQGDWISVGALGRIK